MDAVQLVERLRKGEKILCPKCKKGHYDNTDEKSSYYDTFYCDNPECDNSVHVQYAIDVE